MAVSYECTKYAGVFDPGRLFQPSLMFVGKARNLPESRLPERRYTRLGSGLTHD